jgi:hypothetical protein
MVSGGGGGAIVALGTNGATAQSRRQRQHVSDIRSGLRWLALISPRPIRCCIQMKNAPAGDSGRSVLPRFRQVVLESEPHRGHKVILDHRAVRYSKLIAGPNDEVVPRGDVEAAQNKLGR